MKYFVDMHDDKSHFITSIGEEKCNEVLQSYNAVDEVLFFQLISHCSLYLTLKMPRAADLPVRKPWKLPWLNSMPCRDLQH